MKQRRRRQRGSGDAIASIRATTSATVVGRLHRLTIRLVRARRERYGPKPCGPKPIRARGLRDRWIEEADGVFRGGGVKGLGLAGALLGFAEHPTKPVKKWVNVAGASAGAIIACYLATGHDAQEHGRPDEGDEVRATSRTSRRAASIFGGGSNLFRKHGLAHGEAFRTWFNDDAREGKTFADDEDRPTATTTA